MKHEIKPCPICTKNCPNIVFCVASQMSMRNLANDQIEKLEKEIKELKSKLVFKYKENYMF